MMVDELIPWYKETYDFSLLEVNKYVFKCSVHIMYIVIIGIQQTS